MSGHAKRGRSLKTQATSNESSLHLNRQQKDALFDRLRRRANMRATRGRPLCVLKLDHQLESWRLLHLTLGGLGAVEEVVEINPGLTAQRARVQPNRRGVRSCRGLPLVKSFG